MKKVVLSLILAITALSVSAFGGCSNGQTYGGEKMSRQSEQTMEENKCDNCDNPDCDGTCKDKNGCPDEGKKNIQEKNGNNGKQKGKNGPRAKMPHRDGNRKMPRKPMPVPPSNNGNN